MLGQVVKNLIQLVIFYGLGIGVLLAAPVPMASTQPPAHLMSSMEQRIATFTRHTVATLHYSAYKLGGTHFDPVHGVYIVDCSSYVDDVLKAVDPRTYFRLVAFSGSVKPTTTDYYNFFTRLSTHSKHYWDKVTAAMQLRPGDILVFRHKYDPRDLIPGHIMIVMAKPIIRPGEIVLRVADSAPVRHSQDTRLADMSGIGIGTLLLKIDPRTGSPYAYAWDIGSRWEHDMKFAMARPLDMPVL